MTARYGHFEFYREMWADFICKNFILKIMNCIQRFKRIMLPVILLFITRSYAQDVRFAQPYSNPLHVNPALAGDNTSLKFVLNYRSQWGNIDKGYSTYAFTGMYPLLINEGKSKLDLGLNALKDKAGAFGTTSFTLAAGYNLTLSEAGTLNFSLSGSFVQKSLDAASLTFDNQYVGGEYNSGNPNYEPVLNEKTSYPSVGFGAMWFYKPTGSKAKLNAYIGFSGFNLNEPNESLLSKEAGLPRRFSYQAGLMIKGAGKVDFMPNLKISTQKGASEIAAGTYMVYKVNELTKAILGAWYRPHDALAFALGFELKSMRLEYSYDLVSDLNKYASTSANEITLSYKLKEKEKKSQLMF